MALFDTGWVSCSDWTSQKLGNSVGNNLVHDLGYSLKDLDVQILFNTTESDSGACELPQTAHYLENRGITVYEVDNDTLSIWTGAYGVPFINSSGAADTLTSYVGYYRVIVTRHVGDTGAQGTSGPTGDTGESGTTYLFLVPAWDSATSYAVDDVVFDGSTAYYCIQANTNNQPSTSSSYWTACNSSYVAGSEPSALDGAVWFKE